VLDNREILIQHVDAMRALGPAEGGGGEAAPRELTEILGDGTEKAK